MIYVKLTMQTAMSLHTEEEVYRYPADSWKEGLQDTIERLKLASYSVLSKYKYNTKEELIADLMRIFAKEIRRDRHAARNLINWANEFE